MIDIPTSVTIEIIEIPGEPGSYEVAISERFRAPSSAKKKAAQSVHFSYQSTGQTPDYLGRMINAFVSLLQQQLPSVAHALPVTRTGKIIEDECVSE
jgi:hypothetical protein